jgi:hypothetical protein
MNQDGQGNAWTENGIETRLLMTHAPDDASQQPIPHGKGFRFF